MDMNMTMNMSKVILTPRDYQLEPINYAINTDVAVLGLCPNSGKTEIAIMVISDYLKENPNNKVLILTHSTNVLLDNFVDRLDGLDVDFTYCTDFNVNKQVHICLPHSERKINGQYDFLIVDEAHENYLAERVQRIVKDIKPTKQLLLTGTPSKFIKRGGYNILTLAANEISDKWFSKLNVELVASNYKWKDNYNNDNEVKSNFKFDREDTKKTLNNVVLKLIERIKNGYTAEQFNNPNLITKFKSWAFTYGSVGKTLILSKTIEQANLIYSILRENDVNVGLSHSDSDIDSDEVSKFKNGGYNVLVVVNRARLGYSDESLMNIIDMSGTHNPDLIYQIFARSLRGTPDTQKYYLKVTPQEAGQMDLTHMCVCAALMLTDNKFLSTYDGGNFNGIVIPIIKKIKDTSEPINSTPTTRDNQKKYTIFPEFTNDIIDTFKNIIHNLDNPASIYKTTTIGEVKYRLGLTNNRPQMTVDELIKSAWGHE
jgi:superfamily II DNA or RNA helicase